MIKKLVKQFWLPAAGALIGALAGYLYWKNVGCDSGTCMITSKPVNSTLYFAMMGAILFSMFQPNAKKQTNFSNTPEDSTSENKAAAK